MFGATGEDNFVSRQTKWASIIFGVSTACLAYVAHHPDSGKSILDGGVMQGFQDKPAPAVGSDVPSVPGAPSGSAVPSAPAPATAPTQAAPAASSVPAVPVVPSTPEKPPEPADRKSTRLNSSH